MSRTEELVDTIFAAATAVGTSAITVLRITGPQSGKVLDKLCRKRPEPRKATVLTLWDPRGGMLDRALILWFPGPRSYSGEDSAELHLHGGAAVLFDVTLALVHLGLRPAEPGEFSRRAFLNGRMDLLEAEAVIDLVNAETSAQRVQALRQLEGHLGELYRGWAVRLMRLVAQQEALIDFPDEDLPAEVEEAALCEIGLLVDEFSIHLDDGRRGERLRDGLVFAILGAPNVGKSSLINALTRRDVAIVSPCPGTTRDVLEARLSIGGVPVTLLDTAGLRDESGPIEAEGISRAKQRARDADLVLIVLDASAPSDSLVVPEGISEVLRVVNKIDLAGVVEVEGLAVSARSGAGLDRLVEVLATVAVRMTQSSGPPALTRARHRAALSEARARLSSAREALLPELVGEELRMALQCLGRITGTTPLDDILESVFSQFCIGK